MHNVPLPGSAIIAHLRKQYEAEHEQKKQHDRRERQAQNANTSDHIFRLDNDNNKNDDEV